MERLTEKDAEGYKLVLKNAVECVSDDFLKWSISSSITGKQTIRGYAIDKFAEYEDLEGQGKLLKLPCANWMEIVFGSQEVFWGIDTDYIENPIREITVDSSERIKWYDGWETVVLKGTDENGLDWEFLPEEISKTVFLTKSEAESALKKMEVKNNE